MADKEKKKILKDLNGVVDGLLGELNMTDWKVNVFYGPDPKCDAIADVSFSIHKEADLTVHEYRPEYVREDIMHELLHCKLGLVRKAYELVIDQQNELISDLAQRYEELVIDDFVRVAGKYAQGKKK